jgi:RNA-directed DNA polymerase
MHRNSTNVSTKQERIATLAKQSLQMAFTSLAYLLDLWFEQEVKPRLRRRALLIRYADDFVIGFRGERDAERVMEVMPKRFGKYGLAIHPTKTKLVLLRPASSSTNGGNEPRAHRPGTFDLLGFTHYWARSLRGQWVIKLKTANDRFSRAMRSIDPWCQTNRHISLREQHQKLNEKIRGHYSYYGVTGNSGALSRFLWEVERRWRKSLSRRNRNREFNWPHFRRMLQRHPLARVRTVHSVYRHASNP